MVRTRFAPSPTGSLHIGSARTALYCWLYAKKTHGTFVLRIEDTDVARSTQGSVQGILDALAWLKLDYQEGPIFQTARFERYEAVIQDLLEQGKAYRCYCSKERLEKMRADQMANKEKPRYDGHCRHHKQDHEGPYVVRFKNPEDGMVEFDDPVRGLLKFSNRELDDLIIARSDGTPTYNFTVVVDDWDMNITHVIRGDDHINNTPRQINMLKALGADLPQYAHIPMILGPDGKRLSKRHGAASVMQYRKDGFLPEALMNYLVRLGWSYGDQEIFSIDELIQYFEIKNINRAPAALNPSKLLWLNHHYIKTLDPFHVAQELAWHMKELGVDIHQGPKLSDVVAAQCERFKTLREMAEKSRIFYEPIQLSEEQKAQIPTEIRIIFKDLIDRINALSEWSKENIHTLLQEVASEKELKIGKLAQPLRLAVTGGMPSPSIDVTLTLLGKEKVITRLKQAINS